MPSTEDLLGVWRGAAMFREGARGSEVLVFNKDGAGFLEFYDHAHRFTELFRWEVDEAAELHLKGCQVVQLDQALERREERDSTLSVVVPFRVTLETTRAGRRLRVLRFAFRPWPGTSRHYRFGGSGTAHATFQAPRFVLEDEAAALVDRGKALSRRLARELRARGVATGAIGFSFFGCCWFWQARVNGQKVELAVGWDRGRQEWWLWVRPPRQGAGDEVETLCQVLREILGSVEGVSDLEWHTDEGWGRRARERAAPPQ
jgi:hypothetical protein